MRQLYKHVLIFSVYQKDKTSEENLQNHQGLKNILDLHRISYKSMLGCYNGSPEMSLMVSADQIEMVKSMCRKYNQECFLERENDNMTYLVYPDGSKEYIGFFLPISREEAVASQNYTYDYETKTYWRAG